jgi:hypothetical protein
MPIHTACESCGSRLKAPDALAGRKLKCPKCGVAVAVPTTAVTAAPDPAPPPKPKNPTPRPKPKEPQPRSKPRAPAEAVTERKRPPAEEAPEPEPEERDQDEDRPRRKKRRRRKKRAPSGTPVWVWWLVSGGVVAAIMAIVFIRMAVVGVPPEFFILGIGFSIMMVISTAILIASMFISSAIVGGMEFGEIHVVIPKAIALLFVVNMISMFGCIGWLLMIPVWVVGCMIVFRLELWEARVLVGVNIVLNLLAQFMLIGALAHLATTEPNQGGPGMAQPARPTLNAQQQNDYKALQALGAEIETDPEQQGAPVTMISLSGKKATDADLARLKSFPKLEVLELDGTAITDNGLANLEGLTSLKEITLSETQITDAGLAHLKGLKNLKDLELQKTRVTGAGVQELKAAVPEVQVHW